MSKDKIYLMDQAPEDAGEDFEAAAFAALLEDMAGKAHFLAETLDILAGMELDDPGDGPDPGEDWEDGMETGMEDDMEPDMEAEPETDIFLIPGSAFRLLVGDLYDLYVRHFSLERRLAGAATEKDFRKIQKNASGYERLAKRLCRRWGIPHDGEEPWAYDTLEESLRKNILTPAYLAGSHA